MEMSMEKMAAIIAEHEKEHTEPPEMDESTKALAQGKRKTFDLPTNAVKVDPLR